MIPKGAYKARATASDFGRTTKKGTDFVRVTFRISDGPQEGQMVAWDGYFTEKTEARTCESLRFCGCSSDDPTDLEGLGCREVEIIVEHEHYEDKNGEQKARARVAWVNSLEGAINVEAKMSEAAKLAFKQRVKGAWLQSKKTAAAPESQTTKRTGTDDEIPF